MLRVAPIRKKETHSRIEGVPFISGARKGPEGDEIMDAMYII